MPNFVFKVDFIDSNAGNKGRVSLLSRCRNLAAAESSGSMRQHRCQLMPRIRCETSAAARGDAAALLLTG